MTNISLTIKAANDQKYTVSVDSEASVINLKQTIAPVANVEVERQRLIYAGRVLKDEEPLKTYKIQDGQSVHLVRSLGQNPTAAASNVQDRTQQVPTNIQAGQGANDPLANLTSARFAGYNIPLPSASMFGPNPENPVPPSTEDLANMLSNPMVQSSINEMFSNPQMLDMIINSSPHLRNAPPYVRQMMQSPEFRRAMTDPDTMRQMAQMQQQLGAAGIDPTSLMGDSGLGGLGGMNPGLGGLGGMNPGGAGLGADNASVDPNSAASTIQGLLNNLSGNGLGGAVSPAATAAPSQSTQPPEELYAQQLSQLNEMGFVDFESNVRALRRSGGNVQGAIESLLSEF
ncbi:UBA domain-containing protein Dph1 [Schizosaccharomyces cryophilus OY26]|uniref:UBA domain-containing protein Dph1 n=1 Tax=Schizosaccharomyces cryophilus (strain OY26 / ATCC MYA-4695 / CBS 11777 / NBRC 106824 / NRRL Y48691) TaxID=653667 RepID=S9W207_SCHCR|nr:UBA domain-containing protein Dph1 [Schizosaccharomyces cryophilus OY26]EPY52065.1 UBA domain-containing protein Dph1 [Schizosaccharomyces cryophilus OY26]